MLIATTTKVQHNYLRDDPVLLQIFDTIGTNFKNKLLYIANRIIKRIMTNTQVNITHTSFGTPGSLVVVCTTYIEFE